MSSYNVAPNAPMDTRFQAFLESIELSSVYSQHGEESIIRAILDRIGAANRFCVEAGAADGLFMSNCRLLIDDGWSALLVEPDAEDFQKLQEQFGNRSDVHLHQGLLAAHPQGPHEIKLDDLLEQVGAPRDFDVLSLDVDSCEYYLTLSLLRHQPRIFVVEYNSLVDPMFIPPLRGDGQAGHMAMRYVCEARGYDVICRTPTNLICVRKELSHLLMDSPAQIQITPEPSPQNGAHNNGHRPDAWDIQTTRFLKDARGVIHVGAHEGQERDIYAGFKLPVVWVEAQPEIFQRLQENIGHLPDQRAYQCLLADQDNVSQWFHVASNDGQSSSVFDLALHRRLWPAVEYTDALSLESLTLASLIEREQIEVAQYDALILDVQGAELLVLKGADELLDGFRWIKCETADCEIYKGGAQLSDMDEFLIPRGFTRVETWRGNGSPEIGYAYDVLYERKPASPALYQVFAAGRWQNYHDGCTVEVLPEEQEIANAGKLPVRQLTSQTKPARIALAMSTPRIGYLDCLEQIIDLAYAAGISRTRGAGVFWHHSLSRSIQGALDYVDTDTGAEFDFILTADYDSFATVEHVTALAALLSRHPEVDALAPLQVKRGHFLEVLAGWSGSRNLTLDVVPIDAGHFGFTLFRRQFFEKLAKPWFREQADENGDWGESRTDADIGFWRNAKEAGLYVALAPHIVIGHGDENVVWPRIADGKVTKVYQHVNEWNDTKTAPDGIGVIDEVVAA